MIWTFEELNDIKLFIKELKFSKIRTEFEMSLALPNLSISFHATAQITFKWNAYKKH